MIKIILSTSLLLSISAFAYENSTRCGNLNGSVKYEKVQIISGVPPRPGDLRNWEKATIGGSSYSTGISLKKSRKTAPDWKDRLNKKSYFDATLSVKGVRGVYVVACTQTKYIGPPPMVAHPRHP